MELVVHCKQLYVTTSSMRAPNTCDLLPLTATRKKRGAIFSMEGITTNRLMQSASTGKLANSSVTAQNFSKCILTMKKKNAKREEYLDQLQYCHRKSAVMVARG